MGEVVLLGLVRVVPLCFPQRGLASLQRGLMICGGGLEDPEGLFQPARFYDSVVALGRRLDVMISSSRRGSTIPWSVLRFPASAAGCSVVQCSGLAPFGSAVPRR